MAATWLTTALRQALPRRRGIPPWTAKPGMCCRTSRRDAPCDLGVAKPGIGTQQGGRRPPARGAYGFFAAYEEAGQSPEFAGAWVVERLGAWVPSLRPLASRGIVVKTDTARGGRRAYYTMPDREGVGRALAELEARTGGRP